MSNIYFTSDAHFDHAKNFIFGARGFKSVNEMNEALVKNWNARVKPEDIVYYLGDFCFGGGVNARKFRERLNGTIHFILGNHDKTVEQEPGMFDSVQHYKEIKLDKINIVMFHYPIREWNRAHHGSIALSGHTHSKNKLVDPARRGIHVGVDAWDCTPVSWEQIKSLAVPIQPKPFEVDTDHIPIKEE